MCSITRWIYLLCLMFSSMCVITADILNTLNKVENEMMKDFTKFWSYKKRFASKSELKINENSSFGDGIVNDGIWSRTAIEKMLYKGILGRPVTLAVIGESSTLGADLGCKNSRRAFHFPLAHWWDATIGRITGSLLHRKVIAAGGVGTSYFAKCWKEYLKEDVIVDMAFWEFGINDANITSYNKSLEYFTRSIMKYHSKPGLIFINFFRKDSIKSAIGHSCNTHADEEFIVSRISTYYKATSLSLEQLACTLLSSENPTVDQYELFNGKHPSVLAHAQISYIIIKYFQRVIMSVIQRWKKTNFQGPYTVSTKDEKLISRVMGKPKYFTATQQRFQSTGVKYVNNHTAASDQRHVKRHLINHKRDFLPSVNKIIPPDPLFIDDSLFNRVPICYTGIYVDTRRPLKHSLFDLNVVKNNGFKEVIKTDWKDADETRFDTTGGYNTVKMNKSLTISFNVPSESGVKRTVSVAIRNKFFGGRVKFCLRPFGNHSNCMNQIIDTSDRFRQGVNVHELASVTSGGYVIEIDTISGGVLFCAIIID